MEFKSELKQVAARDFFCRLQKNWIPSSGNVIFRIAYDKVRALTSN